VVPVTLVDAIVVLPYIQQPMLIAATLLHGTVLSMFTQLHLELAQLATVFLQAFT
jgi:hypothetical protein